MSVLTLLLAPLVLPLGSDDIAAREAAGRRLTSLSVLALPACACAESSADPEVRRRGRQAREDILAPLVPLWWRWRAVRMLDDGLDAAIDDDTADDIDWHSWEEWPVYLELVAECRRRGLLKPGERTPAEWEWSCPEYAAEAWQRFLTDMRTRIRHPEGR